MTGRPSSAAARAVQEGLKELDKRRGWRGPLDRKPDFDADEEMKTKEMTTAVVTNPGDLATGLVIKVDSKKATIKTRGIIGKLSIDDARWAAKVIDEKGHSKDFKRFFTDTDIVSRRCRKGKHQKHEGQCGSTRFGTGTRR